MNYLLWHYTDGWYGALLLWRNLFLFPWLFFSLPNHLTHFFSPWKRQVMIAQKPGFHLDELLTALSFNLISRTIGAILRAHLIVVGILASLFLFLVGIVPFLLWIVLPGITYSFYKMRTRIPLDETQEYLARAKGSTKRLAQLLFDSKEGAFVCIRLDVSGETLQRIISAITTDKSLTDISEKTPAALFRLVLSSFTTLSDWFSTYDIHPEDVYETALWYEKLRRTQMKLLITDFGRLRRYRGVGSDWNYGYALTLSHFGRDITRESIPYPLLLGREKELTEMEHVLCKTEHNNILLVGEPGVARHSLVTTLAYRLIQGTTIDELEGFRIFSLDMHAILSEKPRIEDTKELLSQIIKEAKAAGNIILFIDEIDRYLSEGDGRHDFTDIFEALLVGSPACVGITTPQSYHLHIAQNPTREKLFKPITVSAPSSEVVMTELTLAIVPVLEKKHSIFITYQSTRHALESSLRLFPYKPLPGMVTDLLDEASIYATTLLHKSSLNPKIIDAYISQTYHIPSGDIEKREKEILLHLEELLHQRVVNQEVAIKAVAASLRRSRLAISSSKRPTGSFLFLGPTGVGKTETAKSLSSIWYGGSDTVLRFDMSEFQGTDGITRLIGSPSTGTTGELTDRLSDRPFSLLLFDEIEKSPVKIQNLLLTLVDEGYITDAYGKKIDASQAMIIATSNAGSSYIRELVLQGISGEELQKKSLEYILQNRLFSPEFLARFDAAIVFTPLSEGNMREVAKLLLSDLNRRLKSQDITLAVTDELINALAAKGYERQEGGRAMRHVISETIEDDIAKKLLSGNVKRGKTVHIQI